MGFTYKKHKKVGRFRSFEMDYTDIKLNKKIVGSISEISHFLANGGLFRIMFVVERVPDDKNKLDWEWVTLKKKFETENEARGFLGIMFPEIIKKYKLRALSE